MVAAQLFRKFLSRDGRDHHDDGAKHGDSEVDSEALGDCDGRHDPQNGLKAVPSLWAAKAPVLFWPWNSCTASRSIYGWRITGRRSTASCRWAYRLPAAWQPLTRPGSFTAISSLP